MKRILAVFGAVLLVLCFCVMGVAAKEEISDVSNQSEVSFEVSSDAQSEASEEASSETEKTVIPQHPNKKYTPLYAAIGIVGGVGVIAAAVVVSKKMK